MEPDAEASPEQMISNNINPRSAKYDLRHNPKPIAMTTTDFKSQICLGMVSGTTKYTIR